MGKVLLCLFFVFLGGCAFYGLYFLSWLAGPFAGFGAFPADALGIANAAFAVSILGSLLALTVEHRTGKPRELMQRPIGNPLICVGIPAYNEGDAIGLTVKEFRKIKEVSRVVVVDNNSTDDTAEIAKKAGAIVVKEKVQGYGAASLRALKEARKHGNLVCLVEGDQTFFASDLKKLLAYIENADMVVGTRTTMEIVAADSQMTPFMQAGNLFIAKLVQLRYWGRLRLTDVGCTYRLIRPEALDQIIDRLYVTKNHFSPHMILVALSQGLKVIECPIAFQKRVGVSKGVGSDVIKGLQNGLHMIWLTLTS